MPTIEEIEDNINNIITEDNISEKDQNIINEIINTNPSNLENNNEEEITIKHTEDNKTFFYIRKNENAEEENQTSDNQDNKTTNEKINEIYELAMDIKDYTGNIYVITLDKNQIEKYVIKKYNSDVINMNSSNYVNDNFEKDNAENIKLVKRESFDKYVNNFSGDVTYIAEDLSKKVITYKNGNYHKIQIYHSNGRLYQTYEETNGVYIHDIISQNNDTYKNLSCLDIYDSCGIIICNKDTYKTNEGVMSIKQIKNTNSDIHQLYEFEYKYNNGNKHCFNFIIDSNNSKLFKKQGFEIHINNNTVSITDFDDGKEIPINFSINRNTPPKVNTESTNIASNTESNIESNIESNTES